MNEALRAAASVDPKWARSEQRKLWLLKAVTIGAVVALFIGTAAIIIGVHNSADITNVTKRIDSSCQRATEHPNDRKSFGECAAVRRAIAKREPLSNPCISYQRVTGHKGQNCRRSYVDSPQGGDASQQPSSTATQQPSPSGGGGQVSGPKEQGSGGHGGSGGGSSPSSPTPEASTPTPAPESTRPGSPAPEAREVGPVRQTVEGAGEAVKGTVETTVEVVGEVAKEATCHLTAFC